MTIRHSDDSSLQAFGRNLSTIAPAMTEVQTIHGSAAEADASFATSLTALANQSENDLPADRALAAELRLHAQEARRIAEEAAALNERRRKLTANTESLPVLYRKHHELDEDRLNTPRGSLIREQRADVGRAIQDT